MKNKGEKDMDKQMLKRWLLPLFIFCLVVMPFATNHGSDVEAAGDYAKLSEQINTILQDDRLSGGIASISVRDAETGKVVLERMGNTRLKTASNMKLFTASAALETLGSDYRFKTEIYTDGNKKNGKLSGNLYLKGKGDFSLLEEDFQTLAKEVKKRGITEVKGNVVADDSWYNDVRLSEDLVWSDEPFYYGAQISALTASPNTDYDAGTVIVETTPTTVGKPARVAFVPHTNYAKIINHTKTVASDGTKKISVTRNHGTNEILVEGTIPEKATASRSWVTLWEPTGYALDLFTQALQKEGIRVKGKNNTYGITPAKASLLYTKSSKPLSELMVPFMKLSNNTIAESLVKEMGQVVYKEGSWEKGLDVIRAYAEKEGVNVKTLRFRDGSGLSHVTNVPTNEISKLLVNVQKEKWFHDYEYSLPVAGNSDRMTGGTLRNRMKGTAAEGTVLAKTGTITGASALSGYVTTKGGEKLVFSLILNNFIADDVKSIEDRVGVALASYQ